MIFKCLNPSVTKHGLTVNQLIRYIPGNEEDQRPKSCLAHLAFDNLYLASATLIHE